MVKVKNTPNVHYRILDQWTANPENEGDVLGLSIQLARGRRYDVELAIESCPKWRIIRHYFLLREWYTLSQDLGLMEHVHGDH